jgi:hypothetical protein
LLVDDELARAIRSESAAALCCWWGVSAGVVWRWRKALSIGRAGTPGSARLIRAAADKGALAMKERDWSDQEREQRRQRAAVLNEAGVLHGGYRGPWWTTEQLALLGTASDAEVAARIDKSRDAVRAQRVRRGIAALENGRGG